MELIDQHTKNIMEGCKVRARAAGLRFQDETLEYIVTNRDLLEISPKLMIPTLYDYWVHDVEVLREKGRYELYPDNPYETVINTRPAISFYNDNNPDWLNVMIFYHVLAHIDFFQNNLFFRHTWEYDFTGQALADKRVIARLRSEKGRWVDYVIEFARGIDNLVGYHGELSQFNRPQTPDRSRRRDFYFDVFLQSVENVKINEYIKEIERYNKTLRKKDLIQFLMEHSEFLNKEKNNWMKTVMQVVRNTSLFFQPQIRTKIMNEGWASFWHETLFLQDERIQGHEVEFARVNSRVTALPRVGLNPYALGMRLFYYIEEMAEKGKLAYEFQRLADANQREKYDASTGKGREFIFKVRENFCDSMFVHTFLDQDFMTHCNLFVAGKRLNTQRMVWEYFVKSRKAQDFRRMIEDSLYHPPQIEVDPEKSIDHHLYLVHRFEGKPLVKEFIANTMMGIEYLWGGPVQLETSEVVSVSPDQTPGAFADFTKMQPDRQKEPEIEWQRVVYTMKDRQLSREVI